MPKTYTEILSQICQILQDTGNSTFTAQELERYIPRGMTEVSRFRPRQTRETLTTAAGSRDLTLPAESRRHLLWVAALEYPVDREPRQFRNFSRFGDVVAMDIAFLPSAAEDARLYLAQSHILASVGTEDLTGTLKAEAKAGSTTLALQELGTGTINEDTVLTIGGDNTVYAVTSVAVIEEAEAMLSVYPALSATAAADTVVTLSQPPSTLGFELEELMCDYIAGMAAINKAMSNIGAVTVGGAATPQQLQLWGRDKIAMSIQGLRRLTSCRIGQQYPRY